ncbi:MULTISPECIES: YdcF family protein [Paenibacillus]|uniref:YdcF family protein n=1 Tax=Paenibacillus TaxID=44249 RepID=UPI001165ABA9|nr:MULTISPECIES: YdcF family protein [Paenibacillus]AWP28251.1 hypothetical protein B9D94_17250 [Paenibacillus sp. Cedars]MDH6672054.1 uncharacterized SAM-binding protein YcdF (DUF218 family) [Paenibacillus sp. LBL]MPY16404.1 YdcF family protein [Paenibacillus glucanolyticus]
MRQEIHKNLPRAGTKKRAWLRRGMYALLSLVVLGVLWSGYAYWKIESAESSPAEKADVGIILGASMWGDQPSPGLRERLEQALVEYNAGRFDTFIVSGGLDKPGYTYTEAEGMRNFLVEAGVPEERIYLENEATSTYENLLYSQDIMENNGWKTAIIITHDYHGTRSMEVATTLGYDHPSMSLTESTVLPMVKHKSREVLAYTKWTADRLLIAVGVL